MLKKHHRIRVIDGCDQKTFCISRRGWINYLQSRRMCKPGLITLAMKRSGSYTSARWHTDHHICVLPPPVVDLGEVIYDLVKPDCNKISKLHLHHRFIPFKTK